MPKLSADPPTSCSSKTEPLKLPPGAAEPSYLITSSPGGGILESSRVPGAGAYSGWGIAGIAGAGVGAAGGSVGGVIGAAVGSTGARVAGAGAGVGALGGGPVRVGGGVAETAGGVVGAGTTAGGSTGAGCREKAETGIGVSIDGKTTEAILAVGMLMIETMITVTMMNDDVGVNDENGDDDDDDEEKIATIRHDLP